MNKKKTKLVLDDGCDCGIKITYDHKKNTLEFAGIYDGFCGFGCGEMSFEEFCDKLEIKIPKTDE